MSSITETLPENVKIVKPKKPRAIRKPGKSVNFMERSKEFKALEDKLTLKNNNQKYLETKDLPKDLEEFRLKLINFSDRLNALDQLTKNTLDLLKAVAHDVSSSKSTPKSTQTK